MRNLLPLLPNHDAPLAQTLDVLAEVALHRQHPYEWVPRLALRLVRLHRARLGPRPLDRRAVPQVPAKTRNAHA